MTAVAKKPGRKPTGPTTVIVRIPGALKPAVAELVAHYRQAKVKAWEAAPLKQPAAQPEQAIEPGGPEHYSRGLRAWLEDESIKPNQEAQL